MGQSGLPHSGGLQQVEAGVDVGPQPLRQHLRVLRGHRGQVQRTRGRVGLPRPEEERGEIIRRCCVFHSLSVSCFDKVPWNWLLAVHHLYEFPLCQTAPSHYSKTFKKKPTSICFPKFSPEHQMWINPPHKIIPNKYAISSWLEDNKLQWAGNCWTFSKMFVFKDSCLQ